MHDSRNYMIFNVEELPAIDFAQVLETDASTVRISKDGTKTFVKWEGHAMPPCVESLTTKEGPYSYEEIMEILSGDEWVPPDKPME